METVWPDLLGWVGAGLILISPLFGWLHPLLRGAIQGRQLPVLLSDTPLRLSAPLVSFGDIALLIGSIALLSLLFRRHRIRPLLGCLVLLLAYMLIYQVALSSPLWMEVFAGQDQQHVELLQFTKDYLPPNAGVEPDRWPELKTEEVFDRMVTAWYFVGGGWYMVFWGGCLLILSGYFGRMTGRKDVVVALLGLFSLCIVPTLPFLMADYFFEQGENSRIQGRYAQALLDYERAIRYDPGLPYNIRYSLSVGAAYTHLSQRDRPEYHYSQGYLLADRGRIQEALFAYQQASRTGTGGIRRLSQDAIAKLHGKAGLKAYKQGIVAVAAEAWGKALAASDQPVFHYYRAKALFDLGAYSDAISENQRFLEASSNRMLNANAYANIGDCYQKLRNPKKARMSYRRSLVLDHDQNARALMALAGT